ncbi:SAM-dependent methyltransferase [Nonomuraea sp. NPDC004580]|uniref:SAM-dependent methyltransferase n=1 Tax=Nonomuraea sp. NPDC004580 TaxID=3154552 RepID=UPI0033A698F1
MPAYVGRDADGLRHRVTDGTAGRGEPDEGRPERMDEARDVYRRSVSGSIAWRDRDSVRGWFDGLELLEPGVVPVQHWRDDAPHPAPGLERAASWARSAACAADARTPCDICPAGTQARPPASARQTRRPAVAGRRAVKVSGRGGCGGGR